jgi:iron complex transport system ATP-binding protein
MLQIDHLTCGYGDGFQISDISFNIPEGSFTGIIGPNGSGKTTLFRGITGELELRKGSIILNNCDIIHLTAKEKARSLAIVTQQTENIGITVEDYVLMGRLPYRSPLQFFETKTDYDIAHKYLKLTGIEHLKNRYLYRLSGGEKQLAAVARALTQQPDLLLLDEPTSHLDITHQVQTLNLIQHLSGELGLTVLMIIHDLNLAAEYCDYLLMMDNGKLYTKGHPKEVVTYQNIENVYKTVVITQTNPLSKRPAVFLVSEKILKMEEKKKNNF